jgi:hypothetical protein
MGTYDNVLGYKTSLRWLPSSFSHRVDGAPSTIHFSSLLFKIARKSTLKICKSSCGCNIFHRYVGLLEVGSFVALGLDGEAGLSGGRDQGWKDSVATWQIAVP